MKAIEQGERDAVPATVETSGSVMAFQEGRFNHSLQQYMNQPLDNQLEQKFAVALLTMSFLVPVQTQVRRANVTQPKPGLALAVAITTYLADGQRYIPVFTDLAKMNTFLAEAPQMEAFRSFEMTTGELIQEATKLDIAGVLINPGVQSFPLNRDYWQYIQQIQPVLPSEEEAKGEFRFRIIHPTPEKLQTALNREFRHIRKARKAWLIETKLANESKFDYTLIVDYKGTLTEFQEGVARRLAKAAHRYLPHGADILIGTLAEPVGQAVQLEIDPFYERKGWFS